MPRVTINHLDFLEDRQGKKFADVAQDPEIPFEEVLEFFRDEGRQRRMEESELHHDRAPMAGVVRELESHPLVDRFLASFHPQRSQRLRQAVGVVIRMIMERRGWRKTGRKGSLGVRSAGSRNSPHHNTGGLAFWFLRAERYELKEGMPFLSVRRRCRLLESARSQGSSETAARAPTTTDVAETVIAMRNGSADSTEQREAVHSVHSQS